MCGLRTRPRRDVDPPRVTLPSAGWGPIVSPPLTRYLVIITLAHLNAGLSGGVRQVVHLAVADTDTACLGLGGDLSQGGGGVAAGAAAEEDRLDLLLLEFGVLLGAHVALVDAHRRHVCKHVRLADADVPGIPAQVHLATQYDSNHN